MSTELASASYVSPEREPLAATTLTSTSKVQSEIMVAMDRNRSRGWNCYSSTLKETRDEGQTWNVVRTFLGEFIEAVLPLDNGELLVFAQINATTMRKVYLSNGYGAASASWSVVLNGSNPQVKFASSWGLSVHENIVLANEYGPKSGYTWSGGTQIIAEGKNARYSYLSLDYGKSWTTIFDLNNWLTTKGRSTKGQHLHGVAWDPYWDRIWLNFGDNMSGAASNGILYSDDLGSTWQEAHFFSGTNGTQTVGILPMPKCILFAGDVNPSGLYRINRSQRKIHSGHYTLELAYDAPASLGMHLGQSISRIQRVGDDAPAFFGFCPDIVSGPSFVIATYDGYTVTEVWRDSEALASGKGIRNVVGPTLRGNLIVASSDGRVAGKWSEFKGKAPGY
ncbi:hypothetical protein [Pseudarthrobacter sp. PvP090]|uniref:hypothetical protein n=1 Tax=Pseudarthrobacter sp. PvP090 TaxID=3156393 RepID=UPI003395A259